LTVVVLDRPRHEGLINDLRRLGARVKLISDGDLSAALTTTREDSGIDLLLGAGGGAQGVIAAAALRCLGGDLQGRFRPRNQEEVAQLRRMGIMDVQKIYTAEELARGNVVFAATGVTTGEYLQGVRFFKGGAPKGLLVGLRLLESVEKPRALVFPVHHFSGGAACCHFGPPPDRRATVAYLRLATSEGPVVIEPLSGYLDRFQWPAARPQARFHDSRVEDVEGF
jgi:hypothetical protein